METATKTSHLAKKSLNEAHFKQIFLASFLFLLIPASSLPFQPSSFILPSCYVSPPTHVPVRRVGAPTAHRVGVDLAGARRVGEPLRVRLGRGGDFQLPRRRLRALVLHRPRRGRAAPGHVLPRRQLPHTLPPFGRTAGAGARAHDRL